MAEKQSAVDTITENNVPVCIGMQRNRLLTRKVAADLTFVSQGGWITDSVVEFSNEWWNFRYNLKTTNNIKILGPIVTKQICNCSKDNERITFGNELRNLKAVLLDLNSSYFGTEQNKDKETHWSILVYFPSLSLFLHFDSAEGAPNTSTAMRLSHLVHNLVQIKESNSPLTFLNAPTPREVIREDSGLYVAAIAACTAKYLGSILAKCVDVQQISDFMAKLVAESITNDYIMYLRSFLKTLHSKLHNKVYESLMKNRKQEKENFPQKRKLETYNPSNTRRRIEQIVIADMENIQRNLGNCHLY